MRDEGTRFWSGCGISLVTSGRWEPPPETTQERIRTPPHYGIRYSRRCRFTKDEIGLDFSLFLVCSFGSSFFGFLFLLSDVSEKHMYFAYMYIHARSWNLFFFLSCFTFPCIDVFDNPPWLVSAHEYSAPSLVSSPDSSFLCTFCVLSIYPKSHSHSLTRPSLLFFSLSI